MRTRVLFAAAVTVAASFAAAAEPAAEPLDILFLGGTGMLGPHTVDRLIERGHTVTLFNRGNRSEMYPDLELIEGNRIVDIEPGLEPLAEAIKSGRTWDAVIDTASVHTWTENSAKLLAEAADHYVYISSISAYADASDELVEDAAVATMPDDVADGIDRLPYDMTYYGAVKARSEAAAERHFPGRATVIRPGLLVGPRDFTHRFTYWPLRVRQGGKVLAPGNPTDPVMFIDVRDVADFLVTVIENDQYGIFNANGPIDRGMTIGKLLDACKSATGSDAEFVWADAEFLSGRGINAWGQMPVWIPPSSEMSGMNLTSLEKAAAAGLTTRPVEETIRDTLAWFDEWAPEIKESRGYEYAPGENAPGVTLAQEAEVIEAWREQSDG